MRVVNPFHVSAAGRLLVKTRQVQDAVVEPADLRYACGVALVESPQLAAGQGCSEWMYPELHAQAGALVLGIVTAFGETPRQAVMPKGGCPLVVLLVLVHSHAALDGGQWLAGLIAVDSHPAPGAHRFALQLGALNVSGVFQDNQPLLIGPVANVIHVTGQPDPVHR